jgi:hypothetical protein
MEWAFTIAVVAGFLTGCRFRVSALILLSAFAFAVGTITFALLEQSVIDAICKALALVGTLQISYLIGASTAFAAYRFVKNRKQFRNSFPERILRGILSHSRWR